MESNQEIFRFDLDESLYFETGQEVGEMTGISLDPEISIHPLNDYVSIKGVMELRGSYLKDAAREPKEEELSEFAEDQAKRYIENVVSVDEDQAEFSHRFPIEISVPTHRVHNTDDVTVNIGAFDYELLNPNQLKLQSTVEIRGVSAESSQPPDSNLETADSPELLRGSGDSFAFDLKMDQEDESTDEQNAADMTPPPALSQETAPLEDEDPKQTSPSPEKERLKHKKSQTLSEFFGTEEKANPETLEQESSLGTTSSEDYAEPASAAIELTEEDYENDSDESSSSLEEIRYLADMFGDDEEETHSKMRLCIVQRDDTIESIAERYEISAIHLLRQNRFAEEEDLEEGQLLYIPHKKNS
ncbi:stage VI sporulation protein D [Barrientosiimonas marina]|uniref:Stage VI sporulation protein D n=1 Tax=Lentibacillus kimchii TaxID=1542911 RepID=A0ABW2UVU1_9BACI